MTEVRRGGRYRHYKGGVYEVLHIGTHTETDEQMVVYREPDTDGPVWVRPLDVFAGAVTVEGSTEPRFRSL